MRDPVISQIHMFNMFFKLLLGTCVKSSKRHVRSSLHKKHFHMVTEDSMLTMSVSHLKQYFKQKCLNVTEGYTCIITDCPICKGKENGSKLYVNKTTGLFLCDTCKSTGTWDILEKFLSMSSSEGKHNNELDILRTNCQPRENFAQIWKGLIKSCKSITDLSMEEYKILLENFSLPHISQKDMSQLNCFYEKTRETLYFPLVGLNDTIVGYKLLTTDGQREQTIPAAGIGGCLAYKGTSGNEKSAIIVGMIDDLLALIVKKTTNTIVCLPYNLRSLPQELLPYMEKFKKLILWFGNDEISWYTAKNFAKKLNEKRSYFVRPTDLQPRPKIAVKMNYNVTSILENAQPMWHKSIITFQDLREEVLSDLQNNDKVQGVKWKRYPTLNRVLKGHRRGEFTILTGPTGCGKTTFMSEYSLDLAMQGINTLWGSFEIRNVRLVRTMLQQMVGAPLAEDLGNFDVHANAFEKLPIYFMTFHGQQNIKVVMDAVEHATYIHDIAHVVIDNVQFMMGVSDSAKHMDRFWRQDDIIARFRNFATKFNCHVTMIIHPRKERNDEELTTSSIFGSAKATQEADNVLIIQDKRLDTVRGKKYLQVAKNRFSGDLGIMVLDFDKSSLSYAQKVKAKGKCDEKEKSSARKKSAQGTGESTL